jgi:hypothetical protein
MTSQPANPRTDARHAYEHGMPLHVLRRRFHLSDSEAQEVVPEEFETDEQADSVSGY